MIIEKDGHKFEIVDSVPYGYQIWQIGKHAPEFYIPLCEIKEGYKINPDTLKAIHINCADAYKAWETIMTGASYDAVTLEKAIRLSNTTPHNTLEAHMVEKARNAVPYLQNIKWDAKPDTKMKVFTVLATDVDWDEYVGCVVTAENENDVLKMFDIDTNGTAQIKEEYKNVFGENYVEFTARQGKLLVQEVDLTKKGLVFTSFNAG